jgi:hypothetical protein
MKSSTDCRPTRPGPDQLREVTRARVAVRDDTMARCSYASGECTTTAESLRYYSVCSAKIIAKLITLLLHAGRCFILESFVPLPRLPRRPRGVEIREPRAGRGTLQIPITDVH